MELHAPTHRLLNWCIGKVIESGLRCNSQRGSTSRFHVIRDYNDSSKIGPKLNVGLSQNCLLHITGNRDPGKRGGGGGLSLPKMILTGRFPPRGLPS